MIHETAIVERSTIGDNCYIGPFANVYDSTIGDGTKIGAYTEIAAAKVGSGCKIQNHVNIPPGITIGDNVFVGPGVMFTNDMFPSASAEWTLIETRIDDGVSIGAGAIILPGYHVGAGAVVGAGALVAQELKPGDKAVSLPARLTISQRTK